MTGSENSLPAPESEIEAAISALKKLEDAFGRVQAIYLVRGYTDLRRSIDGLNTTLEQLGIDQEDGDLYLFCGRRADLLKGVYRNNGRSTLEIIREDEKKRRYHWPRKGKGVEKIDFDTFLALVNGEKVSFPSPSPSPPPK